MDVLYIFCNFATRFGYILSKMIQFLTDDVTLPAFNQAAIIRWIHRVAAQYGFTVGDITYIFCSDERELTVNRQFLNHDFYTDVITFDYSNAFHLAGDIYISIERVHANAQEVDATYEEELRRIIIHGILHLTGQNDKNPDDKREMTRKENQALTLYRE